MKSLYAPWRMTYVKSEKPEGCIFCKDSLLDDELVLYQGNYSLVMLNRYPYTGGHIMVIPKRHMSELRELAPEERLELFDLIDCAVSILKEAMKPQGFNIGMNLGRAAGAGVEDHLHVHIVPRWTGDTNFMCLLGDVRVISEDIRKTGEQLRFYFSKLKPILD